MVRVHEEVYGDLIKCGLRPKSHWLDNESPLELNDLDKKYNINFQLTPSHIHRRNAAERAIRTCKNHFIANMCTTDYKFPVHLWDRIVEQATMTLNMLRACRFNTKMSAYTALHGEFNYSTTPLAPVGCRVSVHEKPTQRKSWDPHVKLGWYVGPEMNNYRCYKVYIENTGSERITDTVKFISKKYGTPYLTNEEEIAVASNKLSDALLKVNVGKQSSKTLDALRKLSDVFKHTLITDKNIQSIDINVQKDIIGKGNDKNINNLMPPIHRYPTRFKEKMLHEQKNLALHANHVWTQNISVSTCENGINSTRNRNKSSILVDNDTPLPVKLSNFPRKSEKCHKFLRKKCKTNLDSGNAQQSEKFDVQT